MTRFVVAGYVVSLLAFPLALPASAAKPEAAEVRQLANRFLAMLRTEKPTPLDAVGEMLADDFVQSTSHGTVVQGRKENLRWIRTALDEIQTLFDKFDYRFDIQRVKVYPRSALVFGKVKLFGTLKNGGQQFERQIWETMVFEKVGETWKMVHEHSTRVKAD